MPSTEKAIMQLRLLRTFLFDRYRAVGIVQINDCFIF